MIAKSAPILVLMLPGLIYQRYIRKMAVERVQSDIPLSPGEIELFRIAPRMLYAITEKDPKS